MIKPVTGRAVHRCWRWWQWQWHTTDRAWLHRLITKWAKKKGQIDPIFHVWCVHKGARYEFSMIKPVSRSTVHRRWWRCQRQHMTDNTSSHRLFGINAKCANNVTLITCCNSLLSYVSSSALRGESISVAESFTKASSNAISWRRSCLWMIPCFPWWSSERINCVIFY